MSLIFIGRHSKEHRVSYKVQMPDENVFNSCSGFNEESNVSKASFISE